MHKSFRIQILAGAMLAISAITSWTVAQAAGWGVPELMQMLAQKKSDSATFVERKSIAMLDKPVESSGELFFSAPDHLEKRTLKPKAETVQLDGNKLTLVRSDGRSMQVSLSDRPEVSAFVESIRATLSGDRLALERYYAVTLDGTAAHWQLSLAPLQPRMRKVISLVRIAGIQAQVKTIEFEQADGDRSEMIITSTAAR